MDLYDTNTLWRTTAAQIYHKLKFSSQCQKKGNILAWFVPNRLYLETLTYAHMDDLAHSLLARIRCFTTQRINFFYQYIIPL